MKIIGWLLLVLALLSEIFLRVQGILNDWTSNQELKNYFGFYVGITIALICAVILLWRAEEEK